MLQIVNPTNYSCCFHNISFSFTDVGIRIPTGASALGMTRRYDSRSVYRPPLSLRDECAHWRGNPFPYNILQIMLRVYNKQAFMMKNLHFEITML